MLLFSTIFHFFCSPNLTRTASVHIGISFYPIQPMWQADLHGDAGLVIDRSNGKANADLCYGSDI